VQGGTYAGNAVSCAAACAVVDAIQEENILKNVNARSGELFTALRAMQDAHSEHVLDVRGRGLMVAVEFSGAGMAARVAKKCIERGMLILTTSVYEVVRFIPPLNISKADLAKGADIFRAAVDEVVREG
jgi:4-aminobutyrate aminotransferase